MSYEDYLAGEPLIVTAALTGGVHGKEANPNLSEAPDEIGRAAAEAKEAGAAVVHLHARRPNGERSFATERFQEIDDAVRKYADNVIIQHSTGGTGAPAEDRRFPLRTDPPPDRASLNMGPLNRYEHLTSENTRGMVDALHEEMRDRRVERHANLKRKRRDFLHKLSNYYSTEYDLVAIEDLDAKGLVELPGNSRNRAGSAWGTFLRMLEYKCEREGTHFVAVDPTDTTKKCASCGVKTDKPLWVREHSCPSCGFEADRDANAAWNILSRGLEDVGVVHSESTPVETALPVDTPVSAKRVVETGSPTPKERTARAVGE